MNKKSILLLVLIAVFAIIIGVSYSYFIGEINFKGNGSKVYGSMREIDGIQITVEGVLNFEDNEDTFEGYTGIFPGHQNVAVIKVTAEGNGSSAEFKLVWNGSNSLETDLNYYVYKYEGDEPPNPSIACEVKEESASLGNKKIYETCKRTGFENLETVQTSGNVIPGKMFLQTFTLVENETIITTKDNPTVVYYYVVLEYPNEEGSQNNDMFCDNDETCEFSGEVTVEKNGTELADISFVQIHKQDKNNQYQPSSTIPQKGEGYVLNENKSTCGENTALNWDEDKWEISLNNLTGSNQCELYFDRTCGESCKTIISNKTINTRPNTKEEFKKIITEAAMYQAEENGGISYYFAGNSTNNYVKFAGYYWRIIRINYDGTIRMIYAGTTSNATGSSAALPTTSAFNTNNNLAEYVGYKYTLNMIHGNSNDSTIKTALDNFYRNTFKDKDAEKYIDKNASFCNDRSVSTGSGFGSSAANFKAYYRFFTSSDGSIPDTTTLIPTLDCENKKDLFTSVNASKGNKSLAYPIGLITADEIVYAGGRYEGTNTSFYLNTGVGFWTMTPHRQAASDTRVYVYTTKLANNKSSTAYGVRPVINLRADLILKGEGTSTSPYEVEGVSN